MNPYLYPRHRSILYITALLFFTLGLQAQNVREVIKQSGHPGGLIVKIGLDAESLKQLPALRINEQFIINGLDTSEANIQKAKKSLQAQNLYGPINVSHFDGKKLPYAENLVNILIADKTQLSMAEINRVLVPGGIALVNGKKTVKAWPADMDEWTHYLHGPDNNAVSQDDKAGHPSSIQWTDGPKFGRMH